jgi:mannosyltransferase
MSFAGSSTAARPAHNSGHTTAPSGQWPPLWLWLVIALGAALRLWGLGHTSLWIDEPATVGLARLPWPRYVYSWWYGEGSFQTIYFLLMRGWLHFGDSEAWIRLPAALMGIASLPLLYPVARKLVGRQAALLSTAIFALSPSHIYYSQNARSYSMGVLLVMLSTWFFVQAMERGHESDWLLWTLFSVLSVYAHWFAATVMVAQACSLLFWKRPIPWLKMILHTFLIFLVCLPDLSFLTRTSTTFLKTALEVSPTPREFLHLLAFLGGSGAKLIIAVVLWIAAVRAIARTRSTHDAEGYWRGMVVLCWAAVPILLIALVSLKYPVFMQRYMIFTLPGAVILAGFGAAQLRWHNLGDWLAALLCVASVVTFVIGYGKPREDWRAASNSIISAATPGDALLVYPDYARTGFDYYYGRRLNPPALHIFTPPFYDKGPDDQELLRQLDSGSLPSRHVWVMVRQGIRGHDFHAENAAVLHQLQAKFGTPKTLEFHDITVLEYGR